MKLYLVRFPFSLDDADVAVRHEEWCPTAGDVEKTAVRRYQERAKFEDDREDAGDPVGRRTSERCEIMMADFSADRDLIVDLLNMGNANRNGHDWKIAVEAVVSPKPHATARYRDGELVMKVIEQEKTDGDPKPEPKPEDAGGAGEAVGDQRESDAPKDKTGVGHKRKAQAATA